MSTCAQQSVELRDQLSATRAGSNPAAIADAKATLDAMDKTCNSCHKVYRD
jgi:cytochrome c556